MTAAYWFKCCKCIFLFFGCLSARRIAATPRHVWEPRQPLCCDGTAKQQTAQRRFRFLPLNSATKQLRVRYLWKKCNANLLYLFRKKKTPNVTWKKSGRYCEIENKNQYMKWNRNVRKEKHMASYFHLVCNCDLHRFSFLYCSCVTFIFVPWSEGRHFVAISGCGRVRAPRGCRFTISSLHIEYSWTWEAVGGPLVESRPLDLPAGFKTN